MTATHETDRLIRAFLDAGLTELPDRSYDAVRGAIDRTRQRAVFGPRRVIPVPAFFRPAAFAAAVVGLAVIGALLVTRPALPPGSSPGPSSPGLATPPASTTAPTQFLAYTWPGPLAAGRYSTPFTWDLPFEVRFTVPRGWESRDIEVIRDPLLNLAVALVGNTTSDPCTKKPADPPVGDTVEDLAAALEAMPGLDASAPRPITLAGYHGLAVDASVAAAAGCAPIDFELWVDPDGSHLPVTPFAPPLFTAEQRNMTVSILDVAGTRLVVTQLWADAASAADRQELQAVFDSIELGPPSREMSLGSCSLSVSLHGPDAAGPPYRVMLSRMTIDSLNGPVPNPFPITGPVAWLDWRAEGWSGLGRDAPGGSRLIPPPGAPSPGFLTSTAVNGFQGSVVFDAPGRWWVRVSDGRLAQGAGCLRQFPVEVLPMPGT